MKIPSNSTNVVRGRTSVKQADLAEKVRSGELLPEQARHREHLIALRLKCRPAS